MKRRGDKIVMVTAYDAPAALLADEAGVELILVGDSAAMVMLGHESTVPVTLDELIFLTRAVTRAARRPLVIGDLPFGSYEVSDEQAVASAIRLVKEGGADLVKLEGAGRMVSRVRAIAESNIGVMGHIGLTPQSATKLGGFRAQGRTADAALEALRRRAGAPGRRLLRDRARGGAGGGRRPGSPRRSRCRRSGSAPAPAATARCSSGTTCSGCTRAGRRASSSATPSSPRRSATALEAYVADVRSGAFPGGAAHLLDPGRRARAVRGRARRARLDASRRERARPQTGTASTPRAARRPAPAVDGSHAEHEQGDRPGEEHEPEPPEDLAAGAGVGAAAMEEVAAVERELDRPEDERERDRDRGEREQVPRPPVGAVRAELPHRAVQDGAKEPVDDTAVEAAGEECPDRDEEPS